jgi:hypothetical protein
MSVFEREMATYRTLLPYLLDTFHAEGQYAVIRGETCLGVERTYDDALALGYRACGLATFLVKRILPTEPVHTITRILTGEATLPPDRSA